MKTPAPGVGRFPSRVPEFTQGGSKTMKKTVLIFGLISGAIISGTMLASVSFMTAENMKRGEIFGYTGIVLGALLVFFGVRSYRESVAPGRMSFGRGLAVGALIALVSSLCYVATWEIVYFSSPGVGDRLCACVIERVKALGATPEKI